MFKNGKELIKHYEGCRLQAYKCPAGVWSIGYGRTKGVKQGDTCTQAQADAWFDEEYKQYENIVKKLKLNINENQLGALTSFTYNCGSGNLSKLVKGRNVEQIGNALLLYNKANGVILAGLSKRRISERELYFTPCGKSYKVTASGLNVRTGNGVNFKIVDVLKKDDVVSVTEISNGWGKFSSGWINLKYTERL